MKKYLFIQSDQSTITFCQLCKFKYEVDTTDTIANDCNNIGIYLNLWNIDENNSSNRNKMKFTINIINNKYNNNNNNNNNNNKSKIKIKQLLITVDDCTSLINSYSLLTVTNNEVI